MRYARHMFKNVVIAATACICIALSTPSLAQSTLPPTGGSAVLRAPEPPFGGVIGRNRIGHIEILYIRISVCQDVNS